jgi:hypothetical protein
MAIRRGTLRGQTTAIDAFLQKRYPPSPKLVTKEEQQELNKLSRCMEVKEVLDLFNGTIVKYD